MAYEAALNLAWQELENFRLPNNLAIKFLSYEYALDFKERKVISSSSGTPAKDFISILILHYAVSKIKGLPLLSAEWVSFKELSGVEGYAAAFRQRAIEPIIKKYGKNPEGILDILEKFPAKRVNYADLAVVLEAFEGVPALITLWRGDEEFGPEANILFDKSISRIFCIEDIVVLAGMVASKI